ncbi:MAG: hypothetical protein AAB677_02305 [Patescibacteria group bacterium]
MKEFWQKLASLPGREGKGWIVMMGKLSGQIRLHHPLYYKDGFNPVDAVARSEGASQFKFLDLNNKRRIANAAKEYEFRNPKHKRTRIKLLRTLGLKEVSRT